MRRALSSMFGVVLMAGAAKAGIADSPVPLLNGSPAVTVYSISGVITENSLGTYVSCTSTDKVPINVGVELFGPAGGGPVNNAAATYVAVAPGQTAMFGTSASLGSVG